MKNYTVAIVGGGASGILCALTLAKNGIDCVVLEKFDRLGKKLSATGNGQGNVTNRNMQSAAYFSSDVKKAYSVIERFDERRTIEYFNGLGGFFVADEKGRVYPSSMQASSVTDILRAEAARLNVSVLFSFSVKSAVRQKSGYKIVSETGDAVGAKYLVLATGGKASKHLGSDGSGYPIALSLGHGITELYPSLVQCKTETALIKNLKGIRCDVELCVTEGGRTLTKNRGDVIFTDYGISGNAVFAVSPYLCGRSGLTAKIAFLPDVSAAELTAFLTEKASRGVKAESLLCCVVNNQVAKSILKASRLSGGEQGKELVAKTPAIVEKIKGLELAIVGTLGFDNAQVTRGGVKMSEVDENLRSLKQPDLYFSGEILDVDGVCGGYNLQWAFSSGRIVAEDIVRREGR